METTTEQLAVEREIWIEATPETVWEFLVDPDKATRWMGVQAWLEPRPGGVYRVEVVPGRTASGTFVELDPPRRLVFTWGWEPGAGSPVPPGSSTVEIDVRPDGAGTTLRLTHSGLGGAEDVEGHGVGWQHYVARLAVVAAGGDPGPDPWAAPKAA